MHEKEAEIEFVRALCVNAKTLDLPDAAQWAPAGQHVLAVASTDRVTGFVPAAIGDQVPAGGSHPLRNWLEFALPITDVPVLAEAGRLAPFCAALASGSDFAEKNEDSAGLGVQVSEVSQTVPERRRRGRGKSLPPRVGEGEEHLSGSDGRCRSPKKRKLTKTASKRPKKGKGDVSSDGGEQSFEPSEESDKSDEMPSGSEVESDDGKRELEETPKRAKGGRKGTSPARRDSDPGNPITSSADAGSAATLGFGSYAGSVEERELLRVKLTSASDSRHPPIKVHSQISKRHVGSNMRCFRQIAWSPPLPTAIGSGRCMASLLATTTSDGGVYLWSRDQVSVAAAGQAECPPRLKLVGQLTDDFRSWLSPSHVGDAPQIRLRKFHIPRGAEPGEEQFPVGEFSDFVLQLGMATFENPSVAFSPTTAHYRNSQSLEYGTLIAFSAQSCLLVAWIRVTSSEGLRIDLGDAIQLPHGAAEPMPCWPTCGTRVSALKISPLQVRGDEEASGLIYAGTSTGRVYAYPFTVPLTSAHGEKLTPYASDGPRLVLRSSEGFPICGILLKSLRNESSDSVTLVAASAGNRVLFAAQASPASEEALSSEKNGEFYSIPSLAVTEAHAHRLSVASLRSLPLGFSFRTANSEPLASPIAEIISADRATNAICWVVRGDNSAHPSTWTVTSSTICIANVTNAGFGFAGVKPSADVEFQSVPRSLAAKHLGAGVFGGLCLSNTGLLCASARYSGVLELSFGVTPSCPLLSLLETLIQEFNKLAGRTEGTSAAGAFEGLTFQWWDLRHALHGPHFAQQRGSHEKGNAFKEYAMEDEAATNVDALSNVQRQLDQQRRRGGLSKNAVSDALVEALLNYIVPLEAPGCTALPRSEAFDSRKSFGLLAAHCFFEVEIRSGTNALSKIDSPIGLRQAMQTVERLCKAFASACIAAGCGSTGTTAREEPRVKSPSNAVVEWLLSWPRVLWGLWQVALGPDAAEEAPLSGAGGENRNRGLVFEAFTDGNAVLQFCDAEFSRELLSDIWMKKAATFPLDGSLKKVLDARFSEPLRDTCPFCSEETESDMTFSVMVCRADKSHWFPLCARSLQQISGTRPLRVCSLCRRKFVESAEVSGARCPLCANTSLGL